MTFSDLVPPILSRFFRPNLFGAGTWFYSSSKYDAWQAIKYLEAFNCIPEVNAVINMKANAFSNGIPKVVDNKGNEFPDEPVIKLLKSPNWFQAQKEFMKQTKLFHEIYGNEYLFSFFGVGFDWTKSKALFTLPPNLIKSVYKEKEPFFNFIKTPEGVEYYLRNENNTYSDINQEQLLHLNDNRVTIESANSKTLLSGESKLKALTPAINNIRMAYESRGVILKYRGANGAWVTKSKDGVGAPMPLEQKDKDDMLNKLRGYGTLNGQDQDIITNTELAWVQRGSNNPQNLGLFQETEESFNKILDSFGTPSEIFVRQKGATFENQRIAERGMYVRTIIPEANEWAMGLNSKFYPDGKKKLIMDYSHMEIFQDDLKKKADAMNTAIAALSKAFADKAISIEQYQVELEKYGIKKSKAA